MIRRILLVTFLIGSMSSLLKAQDTVVVQTFDYETTTRNEVFEFPTAPHTDYEKILMVYSMRCKDGLVSTGQNRNRGCGEWDYSCNTYITDSTQSDSIKATHPSHFISDFDGTSYNLHKSPTYTYREFKQYDVTYTATTSEVTAAVGSGTLNSDHPFSTSVPVSKSHFLIRASEITGITAGNITGLRLDISALGSTVDFLRIKMKATSLTDLDSTNITSGLQEVYFSNTAIGATGSKDFNFYAPFNWDGTSNIVVEFSYKNNGTGTNSSVNATATPFVSTLYNDKGEDGYLNFRGGARVDLPSAAFSNVSSEVTIAFWALGDPASLPTNTMVLEGRDANNRRQVNVHLPWENSRVYWDCGNDGTGYDRIEKVATPAEFEGKWQHWAFTKNATTGEMTIYLNGAVWHTGSGKNRLIDLTRMAIGSSVVGTNGYYGSLNEFSMWNVALTQSEIQDIMFQDITPTNPNYSNLVAYYQFNDGSGTSASDASPTGVAASFSGVPQWLSLRGRDLYRNFRQSSERPNITLVQGVYTTSIVTTTLRDSALNSLNRVERFQQVGNNINSIDTNYYYQAGYAYVYNDSSGLKVDSIPLSTDSTINVSTFDYYTFTPMKYEIMSFVTPYGIGIDFGLEGKSWTFDVTDFGPILKGKKRISLERGGQFQEEMDIKFLFIKGTPSRDVLDINQLWRVESVPYARILSNEKFEPRSINLLSSASAFKVRTSITGHGQQGEFIPRIHYINVNGGSRELEWQVWAECANNPVYPQGGTWIYDRAGWCPGAPSDVEDLDITSMATPGSPVTIDYGMTGASGDSRYIVNSQLVSYGQPNFTLDAAIDDIISPSNETVYDRMNPICGEPVIRIKNNGSTTLTSLEIEYGTEGGNRRTYEWKGELEFLETEEVTLPVFNWGVSGESTFSVNISKPNGGEDGYESNNALSSVYDAVPTFSKDIVVIMRTNGAANETSFTLKDREGREIFSRSGGLSPNTIYLDTIRDLNGCFQLNVVDSDDDGISFWANGDGNGFIRIREVGGRQVDMNPDFGREITYNFVAGVPPTGVSEAQIDRNLEIYPNPTNGIFTILMDGYGEQVRLQVLNQIGQVKTDLEFSTSNGALIEQIDMSDEPSGVYYIRLIEGENVQVKKLIKK